ncbi:HlyD family secretion protein [Albibacterium indicum]|uniref:HlyD family secretion protein n=1 Tax=Albibacterium indicum TaxID=2292082 RepID=UPI000E50EFD4|nr:HlyD family efflux transporter periplasmic adaptor subunit [Pedobacter indicus]
MKEQLTFEEHSEDIADIIATPPSWLIRWGITMVLMVVLLLIIMSALIKYPDIVKTQVKINTANAPKAVVSRMSGNIVKLLVENGNQIKSGQAIAWLESTADHEDVIGLLNQLTELNNGFSDGNINSLAHIGAPSHLNLGELQGGYQTFYQAYLTFKSSVEGGVLLKRAVFLQAEIENINKQAEQLAKQKALQEEEFVLAEKEFEMYKKLFDKKVISQAEYQQQQSEFLAKHYPLQQTSSSLIANETNLLAKKTELVDLGSQIDDERSRFMQSLNSLISEMEQWRRQYILTARENGTLAYAGFIQENQYIEAGQEIFYINPGSTGFFGEAAIPQYNMGKVQKGQRVLVKLNSYPFEEYGVIEGEVGHVSGVPLNDSIFLSKLILNTKSLKKDITLKTGMRGVAEIVTEDASLFTRLNRNIIKILRGKG